jgi:hypothetical protein
VLFATEYNKNILYRTMQFAMIEQLKKPSAVFGEVVRAHFKHKRCSLKTQFEEWTRLVPQCRALSLEMESLLSKL